MSNFIPSNDLGGAARRLAPGQLHLWRVPLDPPPAVVDREARLLAPDEAERAARFRFDRHRRRYIVGRAFLRRVLGAYVGREPERIEFTYGDKGKPGLAEPPAEPLHFNLSNSSELALVGLTRVAPLGVDLERTRDLSDLEAIAERFFSKSESEVLLALPREQQGEGFFNCWTRKEAYLKAIGDGLTAPLDAFDVTLRPGEEARMTALEGSRDRARRWRLLHLDPGTGYTGAVAIEADVDGVEAWSWRAAPMER